MAVSTDGLSRLSVGGATLSRMASTEKMASTAPAAPSRCPIADLVDDMASLPAALPNSRSTAASSISSPIVEVPWALTYWMSLGCDAGALQRHAHAAIGAIAVLRRSGDVVGIARQAVADHLGVDVRAARLGVLEVLQHDDAGALAHHEAVAVLVVGARGLLRLIVEGRCTAPCRRRNPATAMRQIGLSAPPATITSASSSAISRAASPMACAPVEQAVTTAWLGPLRPCRMET